MKKIGFLSLGHWTSSPQSQTRSASDALLQSIELAVAAEQLGADGAYFRMAGIRSWMRSTRSLDAVVRTTKVRTHSRVAECRQFSHSAAISQGERSFMAIA